MRSFLLSSLLATAAWSGQSLAAYTLADDIEIDKFADSFNFADIPDPTKGYVKYVDRKTAESKKYVQKKDGGYYIGPDFKTKNPAMPGRESVRIESKKTYDVGSLVILDLAHMPNATCGVWPSFWMFGPDWPKNGEIDIIEGVNDQETNLISLHTGNGDCTVDRMDKQNPFTGKMKTTDCRAVQPGHDGDGGCSVSASQEMTGVFSDSLNSGGGAVYAAEVISTGINVWAFPRKSVPEEIKKGGKGSLDPRSWPTPVARFSGSGCDFSKQFQKLSMVFNIDFCGVWAGGDAWDSNPTCGKTGKTCQEYVAENPSLYENAYFLINSLKVYKTGEAAAEKPKCKREVPAKKGVRRATPTKSTKLTKPRTFTSNAPGTAYTFYSNGSVKTNTDLVSDGPDVVPAREGAPIEITVYHPQTTYTVMPDGQTDSNADTSTIVVRKGGPSTEENNPGKTTFVVTRFKDAIPTEYAGQGLAGPVETGKA